MLQIIYRKTVDLDPLHKNPRQISEKDFAILCKSISTNKEYFEARPLILSNRTGMLVVIAGNMRLRAAIYEGIKEVPTILIEGLTEEKEREIIIRDNVNNGEWDMDELANSWDIADLKDWGVELPNFDTGADDNDDRISSSKSSSFEGKIPGDEEPIKFIVTVPQGMLRDIEPFLKKLQEFEGVEYEQMG